MNQFKDHYSVLKGLPLVLGLSQMNAVHTLHPVFLTSTLILCYGLYLSLPSSLFPPDLSIKTMHEFLFSPVYVTCLAHFFILDLITPITFGKQHTSDRVLELLNFLYCKGIKVMHLLAFTGLENISVYTTTYSLML